MAITIYRWTKESSGVYTTFADWVAAVGSTPASVAIGQPITLGGALNIPSNIDIVDIYNGASFSGNYLVTIGRMSCIPRHQIFTGGATALFNSGAVLAQLPVWFGSGLSNPIFNDNISMNSGKTVDGVDISALNSDYLSHSGLTINAHGGIASGNHNHGLGTSDNIVKFISASGFGNSVITESGNLVSVPSIKITQGSYSGNVLVSDGVGSGRWEEMFCSAGSLVYPLPDISGTASGTVVYPSIDMALFNNTNFSGHAKRYTIPAVNLAVTDSGNQLLVANYNSGSPAFQVINQTDTHNHSDIVPLYHLWRVGNEIHSCGFDSLGWGLANKLEHRLHETEFYKITEQGGLIITENTSPANRTIVVSSGNVYTGATSQIVNAFNSSTDTFTLASLSGTTWTYTNQTVYDNANYNISGGLVALTSNYYTVRWYYRSIGDIKQTFYVLGNQYNKLIDAENSQPRTDIPNVLKYHCMLIGKSIIQQGSATGTTSSTLGVVLTALTTPNHNDLGNIQGGTVGNYYHVNLIRESGSYITASGTLVLPKASGTGMMLDTVSPTYGWRDLTAEIHIEGNATLQPTWAQYSGVWYQYQFAGGDTPDQCFVNYHMPHDYAPGTNMYIHSHWSTKVAASGNVQWTYDIMYASGHGNAGGFADQFQTHAITISGVQGAPTAAYGHMIQELQFTNPGGSGGLLDSNKMVVDGLIIVRVSRGGTGSADTLSQSPFLHFVDIHYQSTNMPTKNKAPNFYV